MRSLGGTILGVGLGLKYGSRVSGGSTPPQPQITVVDFFGTTFASFDAGGAGDAFVLPISPSQILGIFYQPTGMESQPDLSADGVTSYVAVNILSALAADIAANTVSALVSFGAFVTATQINGGGIGTAVRFTAATNEALNPAVNVNLPSPASVTVVQEGHA